MEIRTIVADYSVRRQAEDIVGLLDEYAMDPMGGSQALSELTRSSLIRELQKIPHAFSVLCYVDDRPAALANCFVGFSTFKCRPLINIHDLVVAGGFRRKQLSQHLLTKIEEVGREKSCCKITLEVLQGNRIAIAAYEKFGFSNYVLDESTGYALFLEKAL